MGRTNLKCVAVRRCSMSNSAGEGHRKHQKGRDAAQRKRIPPPPEWSSPIRQPGNSAVAAHSHLTITRYPDRAVPATVDRGLIPHQKGAELSIYVTGLLWVLGAAALSAIIVVITRRFGSEEVGEKNLGAGGSVFSIVAG